MCQSVTFILPFIRANFKIISKIFKKNSRKQTKYFKLSHQACIFDWAGTVVDAGVFAPVLTFQKLFEDEGVPITSEEVRAPMGVHKRVSDS